VFKESIHKLMVKQKEGHMRLSGFVKACMVVAVCLLTQGAAIVHAADDGVHDSQRANFCPRMPRCALHWLRPSRRQVEASILICGVLSLIGMESCAPLRTREVIAGTSGQGAG
jgi:hypothetical protein